MQTERRALYTIKSLFDVLEAEGIGSIKREDKLGILYRVFPQKTLEWALSGNYREEIIGLFRRFSSYFNTPVGLIWTPSPERTAIVNFILTGRRGAYLVPVVELSPDFSDFFIPMNMTLFFDAGRVVKKGTRIRARYEDFPGQEGKDIRICFIWLDDELIRNLES